MSVYLSFSMKKSKKLDTQMSGIKHPMSFLSGFSMKMVKKSSIPKMSQIQHPMSVLSGFFHENVKKSSWIKHPMSFIYWFFHENLKKLDTQMSQIKHAMSFLSGFFHENLKNSSIPKCHELDIRCHFYLDFSMKMSKKARYPNVMNSASDVIFIRVFCLKKV